MGIRKPNLSSSIKASPEIFYQKGDMIMLSWKNINKLLFYWKFKHKAKVHGPFVDQNTCQLHHEIFVAAKNVNTENDNKVIYVDFKKRRRIA